MELVTLKVAKKLNTLGYPGKPKYWFPGDGFEAPELWDPSKEGGYGCPEISEVLEWLREEYNLYISIIPKNSGEWISDVYVLGALLGKYPCVQDSMESWKEVAIESILRVIDLFELEKGA